MNIFKAAAIFLVPFLVFALFSCGIKEADKSADIILKNGVVYTMEESQPWAKAIVITGNTITAVLENDSDADSYIGSSTRVIDLQGKFVVPGFIDAHTHLGGFGAQQNDINLMPVTDNGGLRKELSRIVGILGDGEWITGGRWEGHKIWEADWREREDLKKERWEPDRWTIDDISEKNPCFLSSYDRELYLANTAALKAADLEDAKLDGMKLDPEGKPTGLIYAGSPAVQKIHEVTKPKSEERILDELRAGLRVIAERGITEVHDISSEKQMERYAILHKNGELTARIWGRLHIQGCQSIKDRNIEMNTHPVTGEQDDYLRIGGYKGYYDGLMGSHNALLSEPYSDRPGRYGRYRTDTSDDPELVEKSPDKFFNFLKIAFDDGYSVDTHAIGDRGITELIDDYERLSKETGRTLNRFRVIHAMTVQPADFDRFAAMDLIAEVNPSQLEDDMRWVIDRLGPEREKLVYPFRAFIDKGIIMTVGSDIPGAAGAAFSNHPALAINAMVHRTKSDGIPAGGWIPEQKISVHEALEAFTINGAYSVFDEDIRGSIKAGKLADIAVCSVNIIENPNDILKMEIEMTIVDGKIVFERQ
jgi:predicted amidohydrolase YtcJ